MCIECLAHSRARRVKENDLLSKVLEKSSTRTEVFAESFKLLYPKVREEVAKLKREYNERYLSVIAKLEGLSWRGLLYASALANVVDYEMKWSESISESFEDLLPDGVDSEALELVENSRSVAILLDNAGEAVVDSLLALKLALSGKTVTLVAREEPYEVDVTVSEARDILGQVARIVGGTALVEQVRVVSTESIYPAFASSSWRVSRYLREADAVISKGIANLEAALDYGFPESDKVVVALRAKCPPIARLLGVPLGAPVVRVLSKIREPSGGGST